jgi:hypothetical protein
MNLSGYHDPGSVRTYLSGGAGGGGVGRGERNVLWTCGVGGGRYRSEPVFLNIYGAQESISRNEFRQHM